jgi:hypothetical protein
MVVALATPRSTVNGKKVEGAERRHGSGRGKSSEGQELHERSGMKQGREPVEEEAVRRV